MQPEEFIQESLFGKTYPELSIPIVVKTSEPSSQRWMTSGHWRNGGACWMHSSSESPNGVDECSSSLSLILQSSDEQAMDKYLLSAKAAAGILRRSSNRGKTLPPLLERALNDVVRETSTSAKP